MRPWLVALIGVATILVVRAVAHQGNEPTLEEEEEEEERLKMEEVTQSPPVTPPSRAGSGYDLTFSALTSINDGNIISRDEILLSLCPPKKALRAPKPKRNLLLVSTLDGQVTSRLCWIYT